MIGAWQQHRVRAREVNMFRTLGWCRIRDLVPPRGPFSRSTILRYVAAGKLRARKLDGLLLIDIASVDELIATAEPV